MGFQTILTQCLQLSDKWFRLDSDDSIEFIAKGVVEEHGRRTTSMLLQPHPPQLPIANRQLDFYS
jgi:hypothetical protein